MATVHFGRLLGPVGFSRTVAIKCLRPQFAEDPLFVTMFLDEARVAGRIRHPNCVATLDVIAEGREVLLVMDYVHGESLARVQRDLNARGEGIPLPIALRIASDVLQGLHAAHETHDEEGNPLHIIHRDISPQNILLGVDGIARLVDFGVAKAAGRAQNTFEGQLKGKLGYMSPEQLQVGAELTRQVDIHAFAIVFWEMLAGRRLFVGEGEADTIARVLKHEVPLLASTGSRLPPAVDAVLTKGLARDPAERYATAREMCSALESCGAMAATMQVADWMRQEVGPRIDERTKLLRSIERREGGATTTLSGRDSSPVSRPESSEPRSKPGPSATPPAITGSMAAPLGPVVPEEDIALPTSRLLPRALAAVGAMLALGALWSAGAWLGRPRGNASQVPAEVVSVAPIVSASPATPSSPPVVAAPPPSAVAAAAPPPAPPPPALPSIAPPPPRAPAGAAPPERRAPKVSCDPPFTVDPQGVRVPKRECFK